MTIEDREEFINICIENAKCARFFTISKNYDYKLPKSRETYVQFFEFVSNFLKNYFDMTLTDVWYSRVTMLANNDELYEKFVRGCEKFRCF